MNTQDIEKICDDIVRDDWKDGVLGLNGERARQIKDALARWVSVEERLPEHTPGRQYLTKSGIVYDVCIFAGGKWFASGVPVAVDKWREIPDEDTPASPDKVQP